MVLYFWSLQLRVDIVLNPSALSACSHQASRPSPSYVFYWEEPWWVLSPAATQAKDHLKSIFSKARGLIVRAYFQVTSIIKLKGEEKHPSEANEMHLIASTCSQWTPVTHCCFLTSALKTPASALTKASVSSLLSVKQALYLPDCICLAMAIDLLHYHNTERRFLPWIPRHKNHNNRWVIRSDCGILFYFKSD